MKGVKEGPIKRTAAKAAKSITANAVIVIMLALSVAALIISYRQLRKSVEEERVEAVGQIGALLTDRVYQLQSSYEKQLSQAAHILSDRKIDAFEAFVADSEDSSEWIFLDDEGSFFAINGHTAILTQDSSLIQNALDGSEIFSSFISIQGKGDYWAFTHPIEATAISGKNVIALIRLIPVEEFCDNTTVPLYDRMGASYIVDRQGVIVMHPIESIRGELLSGFNLFTSLKSRGVDEAEYADLRAAVSSLREYRNTYLINGTRWLIHVLPSIRDYELVVTIPISLTARATYSGLSAVLISLTFVCVSLAIFLFFNQYSAFRKDKAIQVQLAKAEAKSDFMSKMSHDIRTPLNAVSGLHALALASLDNKVKLHDCIIEAQATDEYLLSLINDVLDMSRIEAGKMRIVTERFDLNAVVNHVIQMEAQAALDAGVTLSCTMLEAFETDYMGDSVRIRQCLMNLVSNAVKFTPDGGRIDLTISASPIDKEIDSVSISVADTGIGMSDDYIENIFTPFEQEKSSTISSASSGSGLGLAIVQNLVQLMGGTITVESAKGVGTRFEIRLPLKKAAKKAPDADDSPTLSNAALQNTFRGRHIMFVEDHKTNRKLYSGLLASTGLVVEEAENGLVCVEKFNASPENYYSLILMDIRMPVMDGLEATGRIRALPRADAKTVPIIALSANVYEEDIKQSLAAGMQMHLSKPINIEELKKALLHYIGGKK